MYLNQYLFLFVSCFIRKEFLGNGDRKSNPGCRPTNKTKNKRKTSEDEHADLLATENLLKTTQVRHSFYDLHINEFYDHPIIINFILFIETERSKLDPLPEEKSTTPSDTYRRVYPDWKPSTTLEKADVVGTIEAIEDAAATPRNPRDKSAWRKSNLNSAEDTAESYSRRVMRQRSREGTTSPLHSIIEEDRRKSVIQQLGDRPASDRLHIYIRRPSDSPESVSSELKSPINIAAMSTVTTTAPLLDTNTVTSDHHSIYIRPSSDHTPSTIVDKAPVDTTNTVDSTPPRRLRRLTSIDDLTNNKIEIDSDNIETPPSQRRQMPAANTSVTDSSTKSVSSPCRKLQTPRPLHKKTIDGSSSRVDQAAVDTATKSTIEAAEKLGDGQFDRHSSARRTRRYKRPTDHSNSGAEDRTPDASATETSPVNAEPDLLDLDSIELPKIEDKDARLKRWQERLKSLDKDDPKHSAAIKVMTRVGKVGRNLSSINQEDVREAIRNLKSPTETPERVWSPPREIIRDKNVPTKASQHELNDEGFEETQSLVSDTPSHGKDSTSSCNEQSEATTTTTGTTGKKASSSNASTVSTIRIRPLRLTSSDSAATTSSETSRKKTVAGSTTTITVKQPYVQSLLERNRASLERSRSLRIPSTLPSVALRTGVLPKRTNSLRHSNGQTATSNSVGPLRSRTTGSVDAVERSGSRTSLRSSRSSLNSAASTNTVRNVGQKSSATSPRSTTTMTLEKSIYKKPLTLSSPATSTTPVSSPIRSRMPASRSSSSGSSIGPTVRRSPAATAVSPSKTNIISSTSFKENQSANTTPVRYAGRSMRLSPSAPSTNNNNNNQYQSGNNNGSSNSISSAAAKITARLSTPPATINSSSGKIQSVSNFMRPTAASSTKFSGAKGK